MSIGDAKLILVTRKTRLDGLVTRFNTLAQARFYIEHLGADFGDYLNEHERYQQALQQTRALLNRIGRVQEVDRGFLANFIFGAQDIVIALGQDGLVANTLKYLDDQPLIGVNPDPKRWDGVLLPFKVNDLTTMVPSVIRGHFRHQDVSMARAQLNDGQTLEAVNDFYIGRRTHVSALYELSFDGWSENQSSSGIVVSTALGSSGWLKSIRTGAQNMIRQDRKRKTPLPTANGAKIQGKSSEIRLETQGSSNRNRRTQAATHNKDRRGSKSKKTKPRPVSRSHFGNRELYFAVREPFPSRNTGTELVTGVIKDHDALHITSAMPEQGVIFSDGMEDDYLSFNSGFQANITLAARSGRLVI